MSGNLEIIQDIPLIIDEAVLRKRLGAENPETWEMAGEVVERVKPLLKPRAVFKPAFVDDRFDDGVVVDGTRFTSGALRKHLNRVERVFPYVVTIGPDLENEIQQTRDGFDQYVLDGLGTLAVAGARLHLESELQKRYGLERISSTSPGSLVDWPLDEQRPLFALLGDVESAVGVSLTESCIMIPVKSVSGIYFPTEVKFYNCQLCPRRECPGRQAAFSEKLALEFGVIQPS